MVMGLVCCLGFEDLCGMWRSTVQGRCAGAADALGLLGRDPSFD